MDNTVVADKTTHSSRSQAAIAPDAFARAPIPQTENNMAAAFAKDIELA